LTVYFEGQSYCL